MRTSLTERIFTDLKGYQIQTATPCQRAWCRALDGVALGDLWEDASVREMFGGVEPAGAALQFVGISGPRTGKSMILASHIIARCMTADLSTFSRVENPPHYPVTSVRVINAQAIVGHVGRLLSTGEWRKYLVGDAKVNSVSIRHPATDIVIPVQVIAGSSQATNLQSYWHLGAVIDEAFQLPGKLDAVVNLDDVQLALKGRVLPGGVTAYVGSPWSPIGPAFELKELHYGKPSAACIVAWGRGVTMHPQLWTPEYCEALRTSPSSLDRDAYTTGAMGQFLGTIGGVLQETQVRACMGGTGRPYRAGREYRCYLDPATRRNAWTLVIAHYEGRRLIVDVAEQWVPTAAKPLDPGVVLSTISSRLREYRTDVAFSDQWSSDALAVLAQERGFRLVEMSLRGGKREEAYRTLVDLFAERSIELPACDAMRRDLLNIQRKVNVSGPSYTLRSTPDGRHADFVPPLALAAASALDEAKKPLSEVFSPNFLDSSEQPAAARRPWPGVLEDFRL